MDFLLVVLVIVANFLFLRANGERDGLTLRAQLPPASTPEGKRSRIVGALVVAFSITAFVTIALHQPGANRSSVIMPVLAGAGVFLVSYLAQKKNK